MTRHRPAMNADPGTPDVPWREWDIRDWNCALFDHFFKVRADATPIRRLIATPSELKRVTRDGGATPTEVHKLFALVFRQRLRARHMSLCTDALSVPWNPEYSSGCEIPPFFAHLMLTCVVASVAGKEGRPVRDFRRRLNRLLGRSDDGRYPLNRLPELWGMLRDWLAVARRDGARYRELTLPDPGHRKLIGHSYWLAFPPHRDRALLSQLLAGHESVPPPNIAHTLALLDAHRAGFTRAFQRELDEFGEAVRTGGDTGLESHPFWVVVLDSIPLPSAVSSSPPKAGKLLLRLDLGPDRGFVLSVLTDRRPDADLSAVQLYDAGEFAVGEYKYLLVAAQEGGDRPSPAHLLLSGAPTLDPSWFCPSSALQGIRRGALLFTISESGAWVSTHTCPADGDELRALVREAVVAPLITGLRSAGASPIVTPSDYSGWAELRAFRGRHAAAVVAEGSVDLGIALRRASSHGSLSLMGGVPLLRGWLGRRGCLPLVAASRGAVTVSEGSGASEAPRHSLIGNADEPRLWSFPDHEWRGSFVLQALEGQTIVARHRVAFRLRADGHTFRSITRPGQWFQEGGADDIEGTLHDPLSPMSIQQAGTWGPTAVDSGGRQPEEITALVEAFAGLACRRRGIEEVEVHHWFDRLLGVSGRLRRDIARAWVERGCFERLVSRRWRRCLYLPRSPRFVLIQSDSGDVEQAVLDGLLPEVTRERIEQAVGALGGQLFCRGTSPWVPPTWLVRLPSTEHIEELTRRIELRAPIAVRSSQLTLASVASLAARASELQRHHTPAGLWDWSSGLFRRRPRMNAGIEIERYRRKDVPDAFVVWRDGESLWHSRSMTWALLVAAWYRGEKPFLLAHSAGMCRAQGIGLYLPLPAGRLAALVGGEPPGPVGTCDAYEYRYDFGSAQLRDRILHLLWPMQLREEVLGRARWLAVRLRAPLSVPHVPLPESVRGTLRRYSSISPIAELARHRCVPRPLWSHVLSLWSNLRRVGEEGDRPS